MSQLGRKTFYYVSSRHGRETYFFSPVCLSQIVSNLMFKENVYAQRADQGQRPISIAHLEPSAQVS